jgi:putative ABC transport system permease protein
VIAYSTAERTKEIGIRLALGGDRRDVIVAIMGDGMRIACVGVVVGLVLAASLSRMIADLLYGIAPVDGPTYAGAAAALSALALIACGVPAWRRVWIH